MSELARLASPIPAPSAFGPMAAGCDVEDRVEATLQRWLASYTYEVERTHDLAVGSLPAPRSWVRSAEVEKFPGDQLPAVMIASPGITSPGVPDGGGYYAARWEIRLGIEVAARGNRRALTLARLYALALRACALQQQNDPALLPPLGVIAVDWIDERYDLLDSIDDRTVCVAVVVISVQVGEAVRRFGPVTPVLPPQGPDPDSPTWPTAIEADVAITKVPLEDEL